MKTMIRSAALAVCLAVPLALSAQTRVVDADVLVTGENPHLRLLDREGGTVLAHVNFWRAYWSPVGPGHVCYVMLGDQDAGGLRIALTDSEEFYEYITDMFAKVAPVYRTQPFRVIKAEITTTYYDGNRRVEHCKSDEYDIELVWGDLDHDFARFVEGTFTDQTAPDRPIMVNWVRVPARSGSITINGERHPGQVYPRDELSSSANVIFGEEWVQ